MCVTWKKVERQGFVKAHWVGFDASGKAVFRVDQQKPVRGTRQNNRVAVVTRIPSGRVGTFSNVAAAKAAVACQ